MVFMGDLFYLREKFWGFADDSTSCVSLLEREDHRYSLGKSWYLPPENQTPLFIHFASEIVLKNHTPSQVWGTSL